MARTDPYLELGTFKAYAGVPAADTRADAAITAVLAATSRQIDNWTGRFFGQSESEALVLTGQLDGSVWLPDLVSLAEVATGDGTGAFATIWPAADYRLLPVSALQRLEPYTRLTALRGAFPHVPDAVRLTGVWGWPAIPAPVVQATMLQANRLWKRNQAPFGIAGATGGGGELGQVMAISSLDPDVKSLLAPYRVLAV